MFSKRYNSAFTDVLIVVLVISVWGCAGPRKLTQLQKEGVAARLELGRGQTPARTPATVSADSVRRDTMTVTGLSGEKLFIMRAEKDEEGDMVAQDILDAAVVTARFRNVAERHGKVDIGFNVIVPQKMQDSKWQIRFTPDMYILEDTLRLDPVIITGKDYRRAQLRGYQQYERFLASIVQDTTRFVNIRLLEIFLQRNIPEVYAFKTDSTLVSDEEFHSIYGVTERQAVEHYTDKFSRGINNRKKSRRGKMYDKYVKVPIVTEGIRLDTVIQAVNGDLVYEYTQTINTRPKLRKVDVVLTGRIYESVECIYEMDPTEPLTFYISSLSSFVDPTERYLTKVVERKVNANTSCKIDFEVAKWEVKEHYSANAGELAYLRGTILKLMEDTEFDLDSVVVQASSSPEGAWAYNKRLSERRGGSVAAYLDNFMKHVKDSIESQQGFFVDENGIISGREVARVAFRSRAYPENWERLDYLVQRDSLLQAEQIEKYFEIRKTHDPDKRELLLKKETFYKYLKEQLYPKVRTVRLDFYLDRKGMVKDTIHTTVLDTVYMRGVQLLRDRDYEAAIQLLSPYRDYNSAIAFCAMDYNASALAILEELPSSAKTDYMMAILYFRRGNDREAVQCYLNAVKEDPSYRFRGNLDPEVNELVKRYNLSAFTEEDTFIY